MTSPIKSATVRGLPVFADGPGTFMEPTEVGTGHTGDNAEDVLNGRLSRGEPAPVLHGALKHMIDWGRRLLEPGSARDFNRLLYLESGPGTGKTTIGLSFAAAMGYDSLVIPAGSGAGDFSRQAIDYKFGGKNDADIITQVNTILEKGSDTEKEQLRRGLKGKLNEAETAIDMEKMQDDGAYLQNVRDISELLKSVRPNHARSAAVDVQEVTGPLLQKLIDYVSARREAKAKGLPEPKPLVIILDEFNRYVNQDKLWQNFWEAAGGKDREAMMEYRDEAGNRATFTFTPADLETIMFVATGNNGKEPGVKELGAAFRDRAKIITLEEFGTLDAAHRLQQKLMNLPVITWMKAMEDQTGAALTEQDREFLSNKARERHQLGMSEEERRNVSAMQLELIEQPLEVAMGIGMIAEGWMWLEKLKAGTAGVERSSKAQQVLKNMEVSPRKLEDLITSACGSPMIGSSAHDSFEGNSKRFLSTDAKKIGTRLVEEMLTKIEPLKKQDPELYDLCLRAYYNFGIISKRQLQENCNAANELDKELKGLPKRHLDEDSLTAAQYINCDGVARQFASRGPVRDALCDSMRTLIPGLGADNDKILKLSEVSSLMKEVEARSKGEDGQLPSLAMLAFKKGAKSKITTDLIDTKVVAPFVYDNIDRDIASNLAQMNISKADQTALNKLDKALDAARESFARATTVEEQAAPTEAMIAAMDAKSALETKIVQKAVADGRDIITKKVREKDKDKKPETIALGPITLDFIAKRDKFRQPVLETGMVIAEKIPTREQFLATLLVSGEGLSNQLQNFSRIIPDKAGTPTSGFAKILAGTHSANIVVGSSRWKVGDNQQGMLFMHFKGNPLAIDPDQQRPMTIMIGNDPIEKDLAEVLQKRQNIRYFSRKELAADEKNRDLMQGSIEQLLDMGAFNKMCEGKKPDDIAKLKVTKNDVASLFDDLRSAVGNCGSLMGSVLQNNGTYEERMAEFIEKELPEDGVSLLVHKRKDGSDRIVPTFFVPQLDIIHKGRVDEGQQAKSV